MIPLAWLDLPDGERRRIEPYIWSAQKTAGQGHVDLFDASERALKQYFRRLAKNGVTAVRLFARARVGRDVLDLSGKLNPDLRRAFEHAFDAARPHGIGFLLQVLPEPPYTSYWFPPARRQYVLPRFSKEEIDGLTPAQRRFLFGDKQAEYSAMFTDPDVLACQTRYLEQALEWIARRPEIFALEVYNEQGATPPPRAPPPENGEIPEWEDAEIRWTAEIVRQIHQRLPAMPVTISHPGFGLTGFDPLRWTSRTGVDFYSAHFYAGQCGESEAADFAVVTAATTAALKAGIRNYPGEWGVLDSTLPEAIRRRAHRDALWLTLMTGAAGFLQWTYEFPEEYRLVEKALRGFSPRPPALALNIKAEYARYHDPARYAGGYPYNAGKRTDNDLRRIFGAYRRSLDLGIPIAFTFEGGLPLDEFPEAVKRPLRAAGGYQFSYMEDSKGGSWIGYLRSREVRSFGRHFLGVPVERPLRLEFDLPEGSYRLRLINAASGKSRRYKIRARDVVTVSERTSEDYVLALRR